MTARRKKVDEIIDEKPLLDEPEIKKPEVLTTTVPLNLRKTAGDMSNDAIMTIIPANTKITTTTSDPKDTEDGVHWIEVRYGKIIGWVNSNFVK